ncbi:MAG: 16S rRNA (guanine(966)-N(2))-methyltransferase RsmD [Actinomycetota bacterium]|nr:16S rRNA (guanine(966)-N(2))-methyltransferase RsmD [Actinomycetota bacterium]
MRVIAGTARGRRLVAPPGRDTRPTSDRVREALFSSIAPAVPGAAVCDLFAGSGALGIEALSRGAAWATFVERDAVAVRAIRQNLRRAGVDDAGQVVPGEAADFCRHPVGGPFDLLLCDPPYAVDSTAIGALLEALRQAGGLTMETLVVVERDRRGPDPAGELPSFLAEDRRRSYGDTVLIYLRVDEAMTP